MAKTLKKTFIHVGLSLALLASIVPHDCSPLREAQAQDEGGGGGGPMGMLGQLLMMMMMMKMMQPQQPQPMPQVAPSSGLTQEQQKRYDDAIRNLQEQLTQLKAQG